TKNNVEELVSLAEQLKTKQLERKMQGEEPLSNAHCVLMYFSPKQYAELEEALLKNGGERSGRGIVGKEEALINALRKAVPGLEKVQQPKGNLAHEPSQDSVRPAPVLLAHLLARLDEIKMTDD